MHDVTKGTTSSSEEPSVLKESPATALVDGNNCLGPVVGNFCMKLAIKKAKEVGVGLVVAQRSTHYGNHNIQNFKREYCASCCLFFKALLDSTHCRHWKKSSSV